MDADVEAWHAGTEGQSTEAALPVGQQCSTAQRPAFAMAVARHPAQSVGQAFVTDAWLAGNALVQPAEPAQELRRLRPIAAAAGK